MALDRDHRQPRTTSTSAHEPHHANTLTSHFRLEGAIGNSAEPLTLPLDPRLNVIIGGRGAGKSTVVAAIRHAYGRLDDLPEAAATDARQFSTQVFGKAGIRGQHHLPISQDLQEAPWTRETGSRTMRSDQLLPTAFAVRVFNQKELYERTTSDRNDPQAGAPVMTAAGSAAVSMS